MVSTNYVEEFEQCWLPQITNAGLNRLIELLEKGSPFLTHGSFHSGPLRGCLATHIAWNHPQTCYLDEDAGVFWLTKIAHLNPATSKVILSWDELGQANWYMRMELVRLLRMEKEHRENFKETAIENASTAPSGNLQNSIELESTRSQKNPLIISKHLK